MNLSTKLALLCAVPFLSSCISLRFGDSSRGDNSFFEMDGIAGAYGEIVDWDDFQGADYGIDVLHNVSDGEVAAVDFGPIFGVGVGLAGFRLRIWPIDFGIGVLAYDPEDANQVNKKGRRRKDRERDREHEEEHEGEKAESDSKNRRPDK